jgi:hypothetical protein
MWRHELIAGLGRRRCSPRNSITWSIMRTPIRFTLAWLIFVILIYLYSHNAYAEQGQSNQTSNALVCSPSMISDALECLKKRALNPDNSSIPLFFVKLLKSVLIMIAVVLLYRIAIVLKIARFVRHLIAAESIILLSTLFEIFTVLFIWLYGLIALSGSSQNPPENLKSALDVIYSFDQASEAIRVILSFFITFWLFLTWSLISRFPKEELPKELFASALGALGIAAAIVTGVSTAFQNVGALIFGRWYLVYTCGVPGRLWNVKNSINRTNEDITKGTTVELLSLGNSAAGILPFS